MSELRVVLLGNSWSERSAVGNFILGETVFNTQEAPHYSLRISGPLQERRIVVINTPDLLLSDISQDKLSEIAGRCVKLSAPGPHVFLLVLQPEDFTEEDKLRLHWILESFSERSFDHSLVLITPREESSGVMGNYRHHPPLQDMIRKCRYRYLKQEHLELPELLTRLGQVVKENNGKHVNCDEFEDAATDLTSDHLRMKQREAKMADWDLVRTVGVKSIMEHSTSYQSSGLRIVLFGKSEDKKTTLGNFIMENKAFNCYKLFLTNKCEAAHGKWKGKPLTVVKNPDIFPLPEESVRQEMRKCMSLCCPGPNVLLLLVKPSEFTEENRPFENYLEEDCDDFVKKLIADCGGRYHVFNNKDQTDHTQVSSLLTKIDSMVKNNGGGCYTNEMFQEAEAAVQKEVEKILNEKKEEMQREKEELERKHEEEMQVMRRRMEEQRSETERERELRAKQLKEKEDHINKEREERKKEQEKREEEDRERKTQEEIQRQEWERKLEAKEKEIKSEEKENVARKLEQSREEMRNERVTWEKKQKESWEKRYQEEEQRREEEQTKFIKLQEEYEQEKEKDANKRKEEDRIRRKQEEKERKTLEEDYKKKLEDMKKRFEEEARKQAEEYNEFKKKYKNLETSNEDLKRKLEEHNKYELFRDLSSQEKNPMEEIEDLKKHLKQKMKDLMTKHENELKVLKERETEIELLEKKHNQDMKGLEENQEEMDKLKEKYKQEIKELKNKYESMCIIL